MKNYIVDIPVHVAKVTSFPIDTSSIKTILFEDVISLVKSDKLTEISTLQNEEIQKIDTCTHLEVTETNSIIEKVFMHNILPFQSNEELHQHNLS